MSTSPIEITGISNAIGVAVGSAHACALLPGGTVQCWGGNYSGQLGRGGTDESDQPDPAPVVGISGAQTLASGDAHTCVRFANGTAKCWGHDRVGGTLGSGANVPFGSPVPLPVVNLP